MMGKKDYQLFADALSLIKKDNERNLIIMFLETIFLKDNPRYNGEKFREWINRRQNNKSMKGLNYNPKYMPLGVK